ncbi:hypothetical protein [Saccharomonospora sp. NB11]|uniref:hypothetical protein n=1 Tax=Saccharomonospora sp. NB11 TaxID=1642298 RepID=UPI0018D12B30|nr:hypothetical protein [Saccharomonospora sp. NB11]
MEIVAAVLATAVLVASCSTAAEDQADAADGRATSGRDTAEVEKDSADDVLGFGESYEGAIRTTVSEPEEFTTSATAQPKQNAPAWGVTIEYENTLDRPFPIAVLDVSGYVGDTKVKAAFDSAQDWDGGLSAGRLAPGTRVEVRYAFLVDDNEGPKMVVVSSMDGSTTATFKDGV